MNWTDIQTWKQAVISVFICLLGCSIGTIGVTFYLIHYHWIFILLSSLVAGLISCVTFMTIWEIIFHKMDFKIAIEHSYKMSIGPIIIMIISENIIMFFMVPDSSSHQVHMTTMHGLKIMLLAMSFGFFVSLPYNYYQLKNDKSHH